MNFRSAPAKLKASCLQLYDWKLKRQAWVRTHLWRPTWHRLEPRMPQPWRQAAFQRDFELWFWRFNRVAKAMVFVLFVLLVYGLRTTPGLRELERFTPRFSSLAMDSSRQAIAEFGRDRRQWLALKDAPKSLVNALISIEDRDFWRHGGIDLGALPSALSPALRGDRARGASTLTQQLAKNAFLGPERSALRKLREFLIALRLERLYTKSELLELYLNEVYLGAGTSGFADASWRYFGVRPQDLKIEQAACLAGLLRKPEALRPDRFPDQALSRRKVVLYAMVQNGKLTEGEADSLSHLPLGLRIRPLQFSADIAPLASDRLQEEVDGYFGKGFADSAGVLITTTLNLRVQKLADSILRFHADTLQRRLDRVTLWGCQMPQRLHRSEENLLGNMDVAWPRFDSLFLRGDAQSAARACPVALRRKSIEASLIVLDTRTGAVRALIGGLHPKRGGYDRATQAGRSPGSSFKGLVYANAIAHGASPADIVDDSPIALPDPDKPSEKWKPHNLEYDYDGRETYRRALYRSRNIPAIRVALRGDLDSLVETAHRFGLRSPLRAIPSLALGGLETNVWEMAAAFRALADSGRFREPFLVEKVINRHGEDLTFSRPPAYSAVSPAAAYILCDMLRDVNIRGTAAEIWAQGFRFPSGGKTGTSNDNRDAWYVGFTPIYTSAIWLGNDDFASLDGHFTGTDAAMPVWRDLMMALHRGHPHQDFKAPPDLKKITLCRRSGLLPGPICDSLATDWQLPNFPPRSRCTAALHEAALATMPHPIAKPNAAQQDTTGFLETLKALFQGPK